MVLEEVIPAENQAEPRRLFDLEERALVFALDVRNFVKSAEVNIWNREYLKQLVRASASVGSNYIEANDALGEKDFIMKVRISRREAKESVFFLKLIDLDGRAELEPIRAGLIDEAGQLKRIFSAMLKNSTEKTKKKD